MDGSDFRGHHNDRPVYTGSRDNFAFGEKNCLHAAVDYQSCEQSIYGESADCSKPGTYMYVCNAGEEGKDEFTSFDFALCSSKRRHFCRHNRLLAVLQQKVIAVMV